MSGDSEIEDSEIEELRQLIENQFQHVEFLTQGVSSRNSDAERVKTNNNTTFMNKIISFTDYFMGDSYRRVEYDPEQANYEEQRYEEILESWKKKEAEARADLTVMNTEYTESLAKQSITAGGRALVAAAKEEMKIAARVAAAKAAVAREEAARGVEAESARLNLAAAAANWVVAHAELAQIRERGARAVGERVATAARVGARVGERMEGAMAAAMVAEEMAAVAAVGGARAAARGARAAKAAARVARAARAATAPSRETAPTVKRPVRAILFSLLRRRRGGMATRKKYYRRRNKRKTKHYKKKTKRYTKKRNMRY